MAPLRSRWRANRWCVSVLLLVVTGCARRGDGPGAPAMKDFAYPGGLVRLRLPAHWRQEADEEGNALFYSKAPGAGTLRLGVITLRSKTKVGPDTLKELLRADGAKRIEMLSEGRALTTSEETSAEEGQPLVLHFWELAHTVPPDHGRIALFSFTIRADQTADPAVKRDLAMLNTEIRNARFASTLGEGDK
jgi:hypothetical protein